MAANKYIHFVYAAMLFSASAVCCHADDKKEMLVIKNAGRVLVGSVDSAFADYNDKVFEGGWLTFRNVNASIVPSKTHDGRKLYETSICYKTGSKDSTGKAYVGTGIYSGALDFFKSEYSVRDVCSNDEILTELRDAMREVLKKDTEENRKRVLNVFDRLAKKAGCGCE